MTQADLMRSIGAALFGERNSTEGMAQALGANPRIVRRWKNGSEPIPRGVWGELLELVWDRVRELEALSDELRKAMGADAIDEMRRRISERQKTSVV